MKIREVNENKKQFISLLLLADEQESMVDRYLEKGTMYVLEDNDVKAECVVTDEGNEILEIKNIAVDPENQGKGYGKALIDFLASKYADEYSVLQVGTGDSPLTIPFYEKCGFVRSHKIPNFFTDNYDHLIYEGGVQLIDMVYLQRHIYLPVCCTRSQQGLGQARPNKKLSQRGTTFSRIENLRPRDGSCPLQFPSVL